MSDAGVVWLRQVIELDKVSAAGEYAYREVTARCDAELAILEEHREWGADGPCMRCATWDTPPPGHERPPGSQFDLMGFLVPWPCETARLLASGYQHREGYAAHWT